ncbi:murein hydrolase activator EnvC family protein [Sulfurivermis fontis]|uniref:murein hydrolase activator EnvC family protein n=1 Tax=Sulfurivermis fontis TaxID=1972068 RepID=UPI000FD91D8F|nr:peptidoglycan DD-metalloendopeptidase family protein [Sulfurivermis fontis]
MRARALLLLLVPALTLASGTIQRDSDPAARAATRQTKEAELLQLRERIASLRGELNKVRTRYDALREELRGVEEAVARISQELRNLDDRLAAQARRLSALQKHRADLEGSIAQQRRYLEQQIRAAYAMGRQEYLKILLNQEDPATLNRALTYYDYLNRARSERITALLETVQQLEGVRREIEAESQRLGQLREQQRLRKVELEKNQAARSGLLAELEQELNSKDRRLKGLLADEKELEQLILALAQALEDIPAEPGNHKPFAQLRGKLPWPVRGRIVESFGSERFGSLRWQGVVLSAKEGLPVRAVSHGRVAFADWLRGYGYLLILDHGDGFMSLYGNNQSLHKDVGDWVSAGETIASIGSSGGNERSGLYFEIRHDGKPQDPTRWCRR